MKIQAINTNTSFKGLFTDKSTQNNGNWRMEYQPYSWESNNTGKMANQESFFLVDSKLPDNEKIYTDMYGRKSCKDILGTEFYYEYADGRARKHITEMPSMNREESLRVVDKKLDVFLDQKQDYRRTLESKLTVRDTAAIDAAEKYNFWSRKHQEAYEYSQGFLQKGEGISRMHSAKNCMDQKHNIIQDSLNETNRIAQTYVKLINSIDAVKDSKEKVSKEIKQLEELRKSGRLIDISRRDIKEANIPLKEALKDAASLPKKFLCLPHKLISMQEILKIVNPRNIANGYDNQVISQIENLIKRTI